MRFTTKLLLAAAAVGLATAAWGGRGHVRCYLFYPECNPLIKVPAERPWTVPADPVSKAAYDYSHALPLPPQMPKPVPFDFKAARLAEGYGGKSVGQQYFEHLCRTEDVEVIVQPAKDVEGFQVLRPRGNSEASPLNKDRYAAEEVTGMGWLTDDDQLDAEPYDDLAATYVQPLYGVYRYVEFEMPGKPGEYWRADRDPHPDVSKHPNGISSNWRTYVRVPHVQRRILVPEITAPYLYTWRGVRRSRDREFGIGGGEYLVVDKRKRQVLGAKRTFNSTYVPSQLGFTNWFAARECGGLDKSQPIPYFVKRVLQPPLNVNDDFVPNNLRGEYHAELERKIKTPYQH